MNVKFATYVVSVIIVSGEIPTSFSYLLCLSSSDSTVMNLDS